MNKLLLPGLLLLAIASSYFLLKPTTDAEQGFAHPLPWQIETLDGGLSTVFGLTLGRDTLADAMQLLGEEVEIAVVIDNQDKAGLEVYASRFKAGPLSGKLVVGAAVDPQTLERMGEQASNARYMASGSRQFALNAEDLARARQMPIQSLSFIPSAQLDEGIIRARFGAAQQIIDSSPESRHFLYPALGLDLTLNSEGRELLQYVAPKDFALLTDPLTEAQ